MKRRVRRVRIRCDQCREMLYRTFNSMKGKKHFFCNKKCMGLWLSEHLVPWVKGKTKEDFPQLCRTGVNKGRKGWNVGLTKETDERVKRNGQSISVALKGSISWKRDLTKETDERVRRNAEAIEIALNRPEVREKKSKAVQGKNNPNYIDGRTHRPYSPSFNKQLKEFIRQRDGYVCQKCSRTEIENGRKLSVHHIDYNKENSLPSNLISLCQWCNGMVNSNRKKWIRYFSKKLKKRQPNLLAELQLSFHS